MSQENPNATSLYDFIYINTGKFSSYLSQLDNAGLIKSVKQISSESHSGSGKCSFGMKGIIGAEGENKEQISQGLEKEFDLSQSLPLETIEALNNSDYIKTDVEKANYGQIVLIKGSMRLLDLGIFNGLWKDIFKAHGYFSKNKKTNRRNQEADMVDMVVRVLESLPPFLSLKMTTTDGEHSFWSSLEYDYVVGNSFDFVLKHDDSIKGEWYMLGILDAKPDEEYIQEDDNSANNESQEDKVDDGLLTIFYNLQRTFKGVAGRNHNEFGITPIAIWRIVNQ